MGMIRLGQKKDDVILNLLKSRKQKFIKFGFSVKTVNLKKNSPWNE